MLCPMNNLEGRNEIRQNSKFEIGDGGPGVGLLGFISGKPAPGDGSIMGGYQVA